MLNLKRFMPTPAQALAGFLGAALIAAPAVAMNMYLKKQLDALAETHNEVFHVYVAWSDSKQKDNAQLKPLYDAAKDGNATALILLSLAQRLGDPKLQIDEALIGFYRNAPEYMLGFIEQVDYLYDPAKREPGEQFITSLSAEQAKSLSQCAVRLQANAGRYEYLISRSNDETFMFMLKQQVAIAHVMLDDLGIRDSTCNDLPV